MECEQRRDSSKDPGRQRHPFSHNPPGQEHGRANGQGTEYRSNCAAKTDDRNDIAMSEEKIGKPHHLQHQYGMKEVLTTSDDEMRFLRLIRLLSKRQVGDRMIGGRGD